MDRPPRLPVRAMVGLTLVRLVGACAIAALGVGGNRILATAFLL